MSKIILALAIAGSIPDAAASAEEPSDATIITPALIEAEEAAPVQFSLSYTSDIWANTRGGLKRGIRYLDNLDVTLTVDAERSIGWNDATLFLHGLYNNGESLTDDLVGDAQVVSNIDAGTQAARLYEAWIEQRFDTGRGSVKVGLYDLNSEFDTNDSAALFINSSHGIGPDFSQSGLNGPSIFPVTSLAVRADYKLTDNWLVRAAVLDGVPGDPNRPKRTVIKLSNSDGALISAEVEFSNDRTKAAIGIWHYTSTFNALTPAPAVDGNNNRGMYINAERKLAMASNGISELSGWLRAGIAETAYNPIKSYVGGGLVYSGAMPNRANDQMGIAVGWIEFGAPYRRALAIAGIPSDRREVKFEATYRAPLAPWLTIQPDVQYIINPGGDPNLRDALVFGLRTEIGF